MPIDPEAAQRLVGDPQFQSLDPSTQLTTFRSFISQSGEPSFDQADELQQQNAAQTILEHYQPGFASKLADVAEVVPVIGGAVRGYREDQLRPLTKLVTLGYEPTTTAGRVVAETGRDLAEFLVAGGVAGLAHAPAEALASKLLGGAGEAAASAIGRAFTAGASGAAERIAAVAGERAISERILTRGLVDFTAGEFFGAVNAVERGVAGGEQAPLEDFIATPLSAAALGLAFMGAGGALRKFGADRGQAAFDAYRTMDPQRTAAVEGEAGKLVSAIQRAAGRTGGLSADQAAELGYRAATEPLSGPESRVVRRALQTQPEILNTEVGRQVLRLQRDRLTSPIVETVPGQTLRVQFDVIDPASGFPVKRGTTVGENAPLEVTTPKDMATLRRAIERHEVVLEGASGDQAHLAALGLAPEPAAAPAPTVPGRAPGGLAIRVAPGQAQPAMQPTPTTTQPGMRLFGAQGQEIPGLPAPVPAEGLAALDALQRENALPRAANLDEVRASPAYRTARLELEAELNQQRDVARQAFEQQTARRSLTPAAQQILQSAARQQFDQASARPSTAELDAQTLERVGFRRDASGQIVSPNAQLVNPQVQLRPIRMLGPSVVAPDDAIMRSIVQRGATSPAPSVGSPITVEISGGRQVAATVTRALADGRVTVDFEGRKITARPTAFGLDVPPSILHPPERLPITPQLTRQVEEIQQQLATGNVLRLQPLATGGDAGVFDVMANDGEQVTLRRRGSSDSVVLPTDAVVNAINAGSAALDRLPLASLEDFTEQMGKELNSNALARQAPDRQAFLTSAEDARNVAQRLRALDTAADQQAPATLAEAPHSTAKAREAKWFDFVGDDEARVKGWSELVRGCPK